MTALATYPGYSDSPDVIKSNLDFARQNFPAELPDPSLSHPGMGSPVTRVPRAPAASGPSFPGFYPGDTNQIRLQGREDELTNRANGIGHALFNQHWTGLSGGVDTRDDEQVNQFGAKFGVNRGILTHGPGLGDNTPRPLSNEEMMQAIKGKIKSNWWQTELPKNQQYQDALRGNDPAGQLVTQRRLGLSPWQSAVNDETVRGQRLGNDVTQQTLPLLTNRLGEENRSLQLRNDLNQQLQPYEVQRGKAGADLSTGMVAPKIAGQNAKNALTTATAGETTARGNLYQNEADNPAAFHPPAAPRATPQATFPAAMLQQRHRDTVQPAAQALRAAQNEYNSALKYLGKDAPEKESAAKAKVDTAQAAYDKARSDFSDFSQPFYEQFGNQSSSPSTGIGGGSYPGTSPTATAAPTAAPSFPGMTVAPAQDTTRPNIDPGSGAASVESDSLRPGLRRITGAANTPIAPASTYPGYHPPPVAAGAGAATVKTDSVEPGPDSGPSRASLMAGADSQPQTANNDSVEAFRGGFQRLTAGAGVASNQASQPGSLQSDGRWQRQQDGTYTHPSRPGMTYADNGKALVLQLPMPPKPGTQLVNGPHNAIIKAYMDAAGGDRDRAREMAQQRGWVP